MLSLAVSLANPGAWGVPIKGTTIPVISGLSCFAQCGRFDHGLLSPRTSKALLRNSFKPYYDYILRELAAPFEQRVTGEDWRDHDKRLIKVLAEDKGDPSERYDVKYMLVNAADYGVPQVRQRVFVVAFRRDLGLANWEFPAATHSEAALLHDQANGDYWARRGVTPRPELIPPTSPRRDQRLPWVTLRDAISDLRALRSGSNGRPPHGCTTTAGREHASIKDIPLTI